MALVAESTSTELSYGFGAPSPTKPGPGVIHSTKSLYTPGKVWFNARDFTGDFPFTRLPLFILAYHAGVCSGWECSKKIQGYRRIIRYAISPTKPITFNFRVEKLGEIGVRVPCAASLISRAEREARVKHPYFSPGRYAAPYLKTYSYIKHYKHRMRRIWAHHVLKLIIEKLIGDYFGKKVSCRGWMGKLQCHLLHWVRARKGEIIDCLVKHGFKHFRAETPASYITFSEVYGRRDLSNLPPRTISYVIRKDPPPVPKGVNVYSVNFWSKVFTHPMGMAVLNSVASLYPVKLKTIATQWKTPEGSIQIHKGKDKDIYIFKYTFNDFEISIDQKQRILVEYIRDTETETITYKKDRTNAWMELLKGTGFLTAFAAIGMVTGAIGSSASATAAKTAVSTTAAKAAAKTGITLTVPKAAAPHLVGVPTIKSSLGLAAAKSAALSSTAITATPGIVSPAALSRLLSFGVKLSPVAARMLLAREAPEAVMAEEEELPLIELERRAQLKEVKLEKPALEKYLPYLIAGGVGLIGALLIS